MTNGLVAQAKGSASSSRRSLRCWLRSVSGIALAAHTLFLSATSDVRAQQANTTDTELKNGTIMLTGRSIPPTTTELNNLKSLWAAKHWEELAAGVVQSGRNIDLLWFYLGETANGLGYADAAKTYYARAQDLSTDTDKTHKCAFYTKGAFLTGTDFCSGFKFPEAILAATTPQPATQVASAAPTPPAPVANIAQLQREFTVTGYVLTAANTCGWPLSEQQKQNAAAFLKIMPSGLTVDQQFQLLYAGKEGYRTVLQKGQMNFCDDDAERKKFDKHAAELWPRGSLAAPTQ